MKIYTRTGDDWTTGLIGGTRLSKSDHRLECCGTIDELNAAIGLAACGAPAPLTTELRQVQSDLFVIGSHLGIPADAPQRQSLPPLSETMVVRLETEIDAAEARLRPLHNFVLPGGNETAARLHLARTICRRAERALAGFALQQFVPTVVLAYVNRLSDWLFVKAREANREAQVPDIPWYGSQQK